MAAHVREHLQFSGIVASLCKILASAEDEKTFPAAFALIANLALDG